MTPIQSLVSHIRAYSARWVNCSLTLPRQAYPAKGVF